MTLINFAQEKAWQGGADLLCAKVGQRKAEDDQEQEAEVEQSDQVEEQKWVFNNDYKDKML